MGGYKRRPSGFDNLIDEYVAEAMAATGTAPARYMSGTPHVSRPAIPLPQAIEPLPRHRAARASIELTYEVQSIQVQSIQTLLDETLAELDEEAVTSVDIPACPMIRRP